MKTNMLTRVDPDLQAALSPVAPSTFGMLHRNRSLLISLVKREFTDRYLGNAFGLVWMLAHPLILISVYVLVFSVILNVQVSVSVRAGTDNYTLYLLAGLIPWMVCSEAINKGCMLMVQNVNLIKQVIFPINILPWKNGIASIVLLSIYTSLLLIYVTVVLNSISWMVFCLPLLMIVQLIFLTGLSYLLSAVGVFFRDIRELVSVFTFIAPYISPIFFMPNSVPEVFRPILYLNPFSYFVWCYQDIFYFQHFSHPLAWIVSGSIAFIIFILGHRFFNFLKPHFADVL